MNRLNAILGLIEQHGYDHVTEFPEDICGLKDMLLTTDLFVGLSISGYTGRYSYERRQDAEKAISSWDGTGDPPGPWIKYKGEGGERSRPKGEN